MKISGTIKPASPHNVALAKLRKLEDAVATGDRVSLEARWKFGRELAGKRVEHKGRQVIPSDLMKLTMETCGISRPEINFRVQFSVMYPTHDLMSNAVRDYRSWHQMVRHGLAEKKEKTALPKSKAGHSAPWVIRRLAKELDHAFTQHAVLSRDQVKDLEALQARLASILEQVDRNDQARAS